jgi:hypothetical protein
MNIVALRNFLCEVANKQSQAIIDDAKHFHVLPAFDGHICTLPTGVKTFADMYWRCDLCKQYWHIKVISNKHTWTMFANVPHE